MRPIWMILTCIVLVVVLAACGSAGLTTVQPDRNEAQTVTPESAPESIQTQPPSPLLSPEVTEPVSTASPDMATGTAPVAGADAGAQKMVDLAKEHLAQELGVAGEQITVAEVEPVVWRDASLGCPKPAIDYIRVETPGYRIVLESDGNTYNYHTDETQRVVLCDTP